MNLTKEALRKINELTIRLKIALRLRITERLVQDAIRLNKEDGLLTKASALEVIREETGLTDDEILNKRPVNY